MRQYLPGLLLAMSVFMAKGQQVLPLYPDTVPNSTNTAVTEERVLGRDSILRISKVSFPELTVFRPRGAEPNGTAVIICPGGGYHHLSFDHEGTDVAAVLSSWGVTAFVLKYRLPSDLIMKNKAIGPLQDAQRAIQLVREHAGQWDIRPDRIGIMGFSAGGHLASTAGTHFTRAFIENGDHISLRPDFMVLVYPVISMTDSLTHAGSRANLLGRHPSREDIIAYSGELQVTGKTPPAFLVHSGDDRGVKVQNSLAFYQALLKHNVPAALRIYPHGGHGFGMDNPTTPDKWMDGLKHWLDANGWLDKINDGKDPASSDAYQGNR